MTLLSSPEYFDAVQFVQHLQSFMEVHAILARDDLFHLHPFMIIPVAFYLEPVLVRIDPVGEASRCSSRCEKRVVYRN